MEFLKKLVHAVNNYDGSSIANEQLRDLVCYISDNSEYSSDPLYRSVLFEAAQLLRTFGYNVQNKITIDEIWSEYGISDIKQLAIQNYYSSKLFPNNLIDKKQKEIIDTFNSLPQKRLVVSAPTSFGKTFILREILFTPRYRYKNMLLVFPTVALLNENTLVINDFVKRLNLDYSVINNVYANVSLNDRNIFILTPERTLKLLADHDDLSLDFFFFDEVYKIDEDYQRDENSSDVSEDTLNEYSVTQISKSRAMAFRIALYLLSKRVNEYYIAGPYLNLEHVKEGFQRYIDNNRISKKQIDFEPTLRIKVEAWGKRGREIDPFKGQVDINFNFQKNNATEKVKGIIDYLKEKKLGQAIIYCSVPKYTMNYARSLISGLDNINLGMIEKHSDFIEHLKRRYGVRLRYDNEIINTSEYWSLIKILSAGYGIHHGKLPKYVQREILKIFNEGDVDYLFCTSTIIEGVNTNAKNVVIINNALGKSPMTAFALKNIRGRAGRYYHHFIGRVFYTKKQQNDIELEDDIQLDFSIFNNQLLQKVDSDNAEIDDLTENNKTRKSTREQQFNKEDLPDRVFMKNRLFPRDIQEEYLYHLKSNVNRFWGLINEPGNIPFFLTYRYLDAILDSLAEVNIISPKQKPAYWAITDRYSTSRFQGLMEYQLRGVTNPEKDIDEAYMTVFTQIRNTVEYEIPRLLSLFESLFIQACSLCGIDTGEWDMSAIIRYFELGVRSPLGIFLVEYGFPIEAIRDIEERLPKLLDMDIKQSIDYIKDNISILSTVLDEYETRLLSTALDSIIVRAS